MKVQVQSGHRNYSCSLIQSHQKVKKIPEFWFLNLAIFVFSLDAECPQ